MNTKPQAPSQDAPKPPMQAKPAAESHRADVTVRVAVPNDRHDEEEKEAGYGHGV